MKRILCFIPILLLSSGAVSADAPAADPCTGPDQHVDLENDMPPIYDQQRAEWCTTFAAKTLLDYNVHMSCEKQHPRQSPQDPDACSYAPETMLSATDLQANNADQDPSLRGKYEDMYSPGSEVMSVIEGAQRYGTLSDKELPLDQKVFVEDGSGNGALVERLENYYDSVTPNPNGSCPVTTNDFDDIKSQYPKLVGIANAVLSSSIQESAKKREFMKQVSETYFPIDESLQKTRTPRSPSFNATYLSTYDKNDFSDFVVKSLNQNQPVEIPLCVYSIFDKEKIDEPRNPGEKCGDHGMVAVGFKKEGDSCMVHLRNTWGDKWPSSRPNADGTIWIKMSSLVDSVNHGLVAGPGGQPIEGPFHATSVSMSADGEPAGNVLIDHESIGVSSVLSGLTWHRAVQGERQGRVTHANQNGVVVVEEGKFNAQGGLAHGSRTASNGNMVWGDFDSDPSKSMPSCGGMKTPDGKMYCVKNFKPVLPSISRKELCKCEK